MSQDISYQVGDISLSLLNPDQHPLRNWPDVMRPFFSEPGRGTERLELTLTLEWPREPPGELLFDSGGVWRVHRRGSGRWYVFRSPAFSNPDYKAVWTDEALTAGRLCLRPDVLQRTHPLDYPLDELLLMHRWAQLGGAEMHACGVVVDGQAVLFLGHSGAGKTTFARLWERSFPKETLLSDDRVVLRQRPGQVMAYGTPWHGEGGFAANASAPLAGLFFLEQAADNKVLPMEKAAAARRLYPMSFPPLFDRPAVEKVLELCEASVASSACGALRFNPQLRVGELWPEIQRLLKR